MDIEPEKKPWLTSPLAPNFSSSCEPEEKVLNEIGIPQLVVVVFIKIS